MNKVLIYIIVIVIIFVAIIFGINVYNKNTKNETKNNIEISEKIVDECTEEWEANNSIEEETHQANYSEEKLSPNCMLTIKRKFNECGHTVNEYLMIPEELINKNEEDLQKAYQEYNIEKYSPNDIIISKNCEGSCKEHFVLRKDDNNNIIIYKINENGNEEIYEQTQISIDYLTETDRNDIINGLKVYGIEKLNQIIEDFE